MSPRDIEPLDPAFDDLLGEHRSAYGHEQAPEASKARVMRRIELGVAGLAAASPGSSHPAVPQGPHATPDPARDLAPSAARRLLSPLAARVVIGLASFAVGGGAGAGAMHAYDARVEAHATASPVVATASATGWVEVDAPRAAPPPASVVPVAPAPPEALVPAPASATQASEEDLAAERLLLDGARASLMQGNAGDAIAPLLEHARRYPRGRLAEEREALLVQALARSGRTREAEERAARFERRFPGSLFLAAVEDVVRSNSDR